ncbi:hypothetical protein CGRA01v4_10944 [Colletotrichum graminicola]|nr:hypothetical protein CGRA01v4_10944 [Colletotrichum graminicola]
MVQRLHEDEKERRRKARAELETIISDINTRPANNDRQMNDPPLRRGNQSYHLTLRAGPVNRHRKAHPRYPHPRSGPARRDHHCCPTAFAPVEGEKKEGEKKGTKRLLDRSCEQHLFCRPERTVSLHHCHLLLGGPFFPGLVRQVSSCAGQFSGFNHCSFSFPHTPLLLTLFIPHIFTPMTTTNPLQARKATLEEEGPSLDRVTGNITVYSRVLHIVGGQ